MSGINGDSDGITIPGALNTDSLPDQPGIPFSGPFISPQAGTAGIAAADPRQSFHQVSPQGDGFPPEGLGTTGGHVGRVGTSGRRRFFSGNGRGRAGS